MVRRRREDKKMGGIEGTKKRGWCGNRDKYSYLLYNIIGTVILYEVVRVEGKSNGVEGEEGGGAIWCVRIIQDQRLH